MSEFSIDQVRGTIEKDISHFLERIESTALDLTSSEPLSSSGEFPAFRIIGDAGHSIYGTSALVEATSLATSARLLEQLAARGEEEMARVARHAERARRIAEAVRAGAAEMRTMLALELEDRADDAQWVALGWQERANELLKAAAEIEAVAKASIAPAEPSDGAVEPFPAPGDVAATNTAVPAADDVFPADAFPEDEAEEIVIEEGEAPAAFDAAPSTPASEEPGEKIHDELLEIFQEEARECLVALQGHLQALSANPKNLTAARGLERLYHTLKGAAATVGLKAVAEIAHALREKMQSVVDDGAPVTEALVDELMSQTSALLETAGLPHVTFTVRGRDRDAAPSRLPATMEGRATFVEEAREAFETASALISAVGTDEGKSALKALATLFHRLRGSALVAKYEDVAGVAAELERTCESGTPSTADLARGLARIAGLAGVSGAHEEESRSAAGAAFESASESSEVPVSAHDGTRDAFVVEAKRTLDEASGLIASMGDGVGSTLELLGRLGRLFHRLKGSALVIGEDAVAKEAGTLQHWCEGESATDASPRALRDGVSRIQSALDIGAAEAGPQDAPTRHAIPPVDPELWQTFVQECAELLETLDNAILALEESDRPRESLAALLPVYHTLKGVVNTMGLAPTGSVLHRVEDFLEGLRKASLLPAMRATTTLLLQVQVEVRRNLKQAKRGYVESFAAKFDAQVARVLADRRVQGAEVEDASEGTLGSSVRESAATGSGAAASASTGEVLGRNFVRVGTDRLDSLMNLAGELVVSRSRLLSRVQALRVLQQDLKRGSRRIIDTVERFCEEHEFARLDGRAAQQPAVFALAAGAEPVSELRPVADAPQSDVAPVANDGAWGAFSDLELDRYEAIHVLSRSLAELSSDFGEMFTQASAGVSALMDDSDAFGGIVGGIQSEITRARMVPLDALFSRLRLPIRDAAVREQKDVRVSTQGEGVHLDKTIADALFQPMLHLVRNAVAHGIESERARQDAGKPATGTIELAARQELGQIVLEIRDDGAGLDLHKLRARGIAMGVIGEDVPLDDPAVKDLVFAAGLSTAVSARAVAGRGVGCEFVRRAVERLNGSIHVESSSGRGTCFVLTLPLTLAITRALLVRQGGRTYALPLYFAERILESAGQQRVDSAGVRRVHFEDAFVPISGLSSFLGGERERTEGAIVVLRSGAERIMLQVDEVVGQEEIVVKNLGAVLTGHPLFAGVTIRGTGEMVLILDVPGLAQARQTTFPAPARLRSAQTAVEASIEVAPRPPAPAPQHDPTRRRRILFVDDSLSVRKVAEKVLTGLGVDVKLAVDGVDALAKMRESSFDLVFTDLEMPRMHGFELIRELRFLAAYQDLPIVVVTSRSGQKHQDQARTLGATEYLTKPFTAKSIGAVLDKWAQTRKAGGV